MFNCVLTCEVIIIKMGYIMKIILLVIGVLTLSFGPILARADDDAQDTGRVVVLRKEIVDYNRIQPLQNPRYERSGKIVNRRVTDSKNKVIGDVKDVLFDKGGRVTSLYVDFDRLNLGQSVYLNYGSLDINSTSSGYRLGFNSDEIETLYPALLSGIEAAVGDSDGDDSAIFSLNNVLGSAVVDSDGRSIGKLEDVLFDSNGAYVRSAYLSINYQTIHNKGVAVPLSILEFEEKYGKTQIVIDTRYVEPILEMAKGN